MASLAPGPGSWTSYVVAQGSSVNVPTSNMEAAWPVMAWPGTSHGITSTVVQACPDSGKETETHLSMEEFFFNLQSCFKLTIFQYKVIYAWGREECGILSPSF